MSIFYNLYENNFLYLAKSTLYIDSPPDLYLKDVVSLRLFTSIFYGSRCQNQLFNYFKK
jgi:hypothetical protein